MEMTEFGPGDGRDWLNTFNVNHFHFCHSNYKMSNKNRIDRSTDSFEFHLCKSYNEDMLST